MSKRRRGPRALALNDASAQHLVRPGDTAVRYVLIALCAVVFASSIAPTPAAAWWHDAWRVRALHHPCAHHNSKHCVSKHR